MAICTAKYEWTSDEYVAAMRAHYSLNFREGYRVLLKLASGLLLVFIVFVTLVAIVFPYDEPAPYWAFALVGIISAYGLVYDIVNVWYWKRRFKRGHQVGEIEWIFAHDAIQMKTSLAETTVKWEAFVKVAEVVDGFLIYSTKSLFSWIPFRSFESVECIETVRELMIKNNLFTRRQ